MQAVSGGLDCVSDLVFDEWLAGELDAPGRARAELHLADCVRCQRRHAQLAREHAAFLQAAPSFRAHEALLRPHTAPPATEIERAPRWRRWLRPGLVAAVAASMLLFVRVPAPGPSTRAKGAPHIDLFLKRGNSVWRGSSGATVHAGDLVRVTYSSDRELYFALFGRDARTAQLYYPSGAEAVRIRAGADVALPFSIELDASPGEEHVVAVFCEDAFALEPLRAALRDSPRLPAAAGCRVDSVMLRKDAMP